MRSGETAKADSVKFTNRYDSPAEEAKTTVARPAKNTAAPAARTAKGSAAPALPQTGDAFPVEALAPPRSAPGLLALPQPGQSTGKPAPAVTDWS